MLKCWQNLSKLTNHRVYQILVHRDDLLLSFHRRVFSLPLAALFFFYRYIFSLAVFYTAAWLTERLEEATWDEATILRTNNNWQLRKILEAWEINCAKDPLNRDDGGVTPQGVFLHWTRANKRKWHMSWILISVLFISVLLCRFFLKEKRGPRLRPKRQEHFYCKWLQHHF